MSVLESTFDTVGLYGYNDRVKYPNCPENFSKEIYTAFSHLTGNNSQAVKIGSIQTFAEPKDDEGSWLIRIRYYTHDDNGNGGWVFPSNNDAKALVLSRCAKL